MGSLRPEGHEIIASGFLRCSLCCRETTEQPMQVGEYPFLAIRAAIRRDRFWGSHAQRVSPLAVDGFSSVGG